MLHYPNIYMQKIRKLDKIQKFVHENFLSYWMSDGYSSSCGAVPGLDIGFEALY